MLVAIPLTGAGAAGLAYDEKLADRLRSVYAAAAAEVVEKKMFGGIAFMVSGHMSCGVVGDTLMVRIGPERYESALRQPHAREMDFTGKPMKGFIYVAPEGLQAEDDLEAWVQASLAFVRSLPPK